MLASIYRLASVVNRKLFRQIPDLQTNLFILFQYLSPCLVGEPIFQSLSAGFHTKASLDVPERNRYTR